MIKITDNLHDTLMNTAYSKYPKNVSHFEFLLSLTPIERTAVVLGNLNYQVENGGFSQWSFNGYKKSTIQFIEIIYKNIDKNKYPELTKALHMAMTYTNQRGFDDKYYELDNVLEEMNEYLIETNNK